MKKLCKWESTKLFRSCEANASIGSELQVCVFALNSSAHFARDNTSSFSVLAALKHRDQTPTLAEADSAVTSQYFAVSAGIP